LGWISHLLTPLYGKIRSVVVVVVVVVVGGGGGGGVLSY